MRAIFYEEFGGPEVLKLGERPRPAPRAEEVLVRIRAAGVNPIDWKIRDGMFDGIWPHEFPIIPGWDAAGEIAALGSAAQGFDVGERVYAYTRSGAVHHGTYAEYIAVPAAFVAAMPKTLNFAEAAATPVTALTAYQSLFTFARLKAGQSVLIHAAAGGVGSFAVQIAKHAGASVTGTASGKNEDYVRSLGADHFVDYREDDAWEKLRSHAPQGYDVVFDTVGGATLEKSYALLKDDGALPALNDEPDEELCAARGIRGMRMFAEPSGDELRTVARWIDEGAVKMPALDVLPLEDAAEAMARSKAGHVRGKLALEIA